VESGSRGTNRINKGGSVRERSSDPSIPEWNLDREARTESIKEAVMREREFNPPIPEWSLDREARIASIKEAV
jgi:hypothetical protein